MIYDAQRNVVVYNVADPARFLHYVHGAKHLYNGYVAAPATLTNLQIMRCLGLPVLEPLEKDYDWPHGPQIQAPLASQRRTANFFVVHPRCLCLSDPGTGKTLSALWAADALMQRSRDRLRALVVAPLSSLKDTWANEIFTNFMGRRTAVILHGSAQKRRKLLQESNVDFYIINHDGVATDAKITGKKGRRRLELDGFSRMLSERKDIRLAIVDEISAYRDSSTERSYVARQLLSTRDYFWGMTGTPTPNGPMDAFGIRKLMTPNWPETKTGWRARTMFQVSTYVWKPRKGAHEAARAILTPAIRFSLDECVDLPEMITQTRDVEATPGQMEAFRELKREYVFELEGGAKVTALNEAVLRMKFLQIACGAVYDTKHKAHHIDCKPRLKVLNEVIEESNDKIIVFAPFTSIVNMLTIALKKYSTATITGEVSFKDRSAIFEKFKQERDPHILVADPGTMSHSLNLTVAKTVIWFGPKDNTEIYLQANRRIRRPGQNKPQRIVHLACHAAEREIYRRLANNEALQGAMLKLVEEDR